MSLGDMLIKLSADLDVQQDADGRFSAVGQGHVKWPGGSVVDFPLAFDVIDQVGGDSSRPQPAPTDSAQA